MKIITKDMKFASGKNITKYELSNSAGMKVEVLSWGATLTKIVVPDKTGNFENVLLEWDDLNTYENNPGYFGATVGRIAGRIADAKVTLDDKVYTFVKNTFGNTLHGGATGFDKINWKGQVEEREDAIVLTLSYLSPDGEEGFPGNLHAKAIYMLKEDNTLTLTYEATTDKETIVNLTNHAYFNLSGEAKRSVLEQQVYINSQQICELDKELIPTGKFLDVDDQSAFDFRKPKAIGKDIEEDNLHLKNGCGYDHYWILEKGEKAAELYDPISGRLMEISTTAPGVVVYTMNHADGVTKLSNGEGQQRRYGICFETQKKPIGKNEVFKEDVILKPGNIYRQETTFKFSNR